MFFQKNPTMTPMLSAIARVGAMATVALGLAACGAPSQVVGEVDGETFSVSDAAPEVRENKDALLIVMAEATDETLRTIVIRVPNEGRIKPNKPLPIGPQGSGAISLEVSEGPLQESTRDDGVHIINSTDPTFFPARSGTITFDEVGDVFAGDFTATLSSGDVIDGVFRAEVGAD